ncbi:MAG: hypothetical protein Q9214_006335, partial [Letrouitia sp. 1 TL-2023]
TVAPWAAESSAYGYGTFGFHDRYPEEVMFGSTDDHVERKRNAQLAGIPDSTNLTSQNEGGTTASKSNTRTTEPMFIHYHVPGTNVMLAMTFPPDARIISPVIIPEIISQARRYLQTMATAHGGSHASIKGRFTKTTDGVKFEVRGNPFHKGEDWPTYGDVGSVLVGIYNEIEKLNYLETKIEMSRVNDPVPFGHADFVFSRRAPDTAVANLTGQLPEGSVLAQRSLSSNQEIVYPVPGTDVSLLMVHAGPPPRGTPPARPIPPNAIHACLVYASGYVGYLAGRHGGWHHPLAEYFMSVREGVRLEVYGNHQVAHVDWPTYLDVMTVIRGLHDKLPQLRNFETEVIMYRNGRHRPFGFADLVFDDRPMAATNMTEEKQSNLTRVTLPSGAGGLNQ